MKIVSEFRTFLLKQNALALAVGVVIGAAIGKVVSGIVDDLIMPIIGTVMPGGDWRNAQYVLSGTSAIKYGDFLGRVVDFIIIAAVVFFMVNLPFKRECQRVANRAAPSISFAARW